MERFAMKGVKVGHLWGFDSFEGLPRDDSSQQSKSTYGDMVAEGKFDVLAYVQETWPTVEQQIIDFIGYPNATLIKGFFNDTLKDKIAKERGMRPAFFVSIDVDLYSS